jgi:hypothetical protein
VKDFLNTDQRQMQLFPEGDTIPAAISSQSQENFKPQYANVFSLFDKRGVEENNAERVVTRKVLALLEL